MTKEELKPLYIEWIKDYCNIKVINEDHLPGGVQLALDQLLELDPLQFNIASEGIDGLSQTFSNDGDIPKHIYKYLRPYKRVKII